VSKYVWTIDKMVTQKRAAHVARLLYPDAYHEPGYNCRAEIGREGEPCRICLGNEAEWLETVACVRAAIIAAFS
jgi:hypothetical protein